MVHIQLNSAFNDIVVGSRRAGKQNRTGPGLSTHACYPDEGNSSEFVHGRDSHGFSDLKESMKYHCALTHGLDNVNPTKFSLSTPASLWSCMERCWNHCAPISNRLIEDIMAFPVFLDIIIAHSS